MGNSNHDPKTGEFSEGPGGAGASGHLARVAKQTGLSVTRESSLPAAGSFETSMAELKKNINSLEKANNAAKSRSSIFNYAARNLGIKVKF